LSAAVLDSQTVRAAPAAGGAGHQARPCRTARATECCCGHWPPASTGSTWPGRRHLQWRWAVVCQRCCRIS